MNPSAVPIQVTKFNAGRISHTEDPIIDEQQLRVMINGSRAYDMVYSTGHPGELVTGLLFTQGIIERHADIAGWELDADAGLCRVTLKDPDRIAGGFPLVKGSSGGYLVPGSTSSSSALPLPARPVLVPGQVNALMDLHYEHSRLFKETGAVHSAGLTDGTRMLAFFEDIGRHNALDKLAGHMLMEKIFPGDKVATLSCRLSLEIIGKLVRTRIPVVLSNAAPTRAAVELARENGLTMIGFARGNRFNIYSHPERIDFPSPA